MQRTKTRWIGVFAGSIVLLGSLGAPAGEASDAGRPRRPPTVLLVASADLLQDAFLQPADKSHPGTGRFFVRALDVLVAPSPILDIECRAPRRRAVRKDTEKLESTLRRGIALIAKRYLEESDPRLKGGLGEDDDAFLDDVATKIAAGAVERLERRWPAEVAEIEVSPPMTRILQSIQEPIRITYYVSGEPPATLKEVVRFTDDYLHELGRLFPDRLSVRVVNPEDEASRYAKAEVQEYKAALARGAAPSEPVVPPDPMEMITGRPPSTPEARRRNREGQAQQIARESGRELDDVYDELLADEFQDAYFGELERKGVRGLMARLPGGRRNPPQEVFSALTLDTGDGRVEVVPAVLTPDTVELDVATSLVRLLRREKPRVLLVDLSQAEDDGAPSSPPEPFGPAAARRQSDLAALAGALQPQFDIRLVERSAGGSLADAVQGGSWSEVDALVLARLDRVSAKDVGAIRDAVDAGVPTMVLVSPWSLDASDDGVRQGLPLRALDPGREIRTLLESWGVEPGPGILASRSCGSVPLPRSLGGIMVRMAAPLPLVISLDQDTLLSTSPLFPSGGLVVPLSSGLTLAGAPSDDFGLRRTVLARTPEKSWRVPLDPADANRPIHEIEACRELVGAVPESPHPFLKEPVPLIVLLRGD